MHPVFADLAPPVLMDGAVGTELIRLGWDRKTSLERWACDHSDITLKLHRDYVAAGARIIYTATHGANWTRLSRYGEQTSVGELNRKLATLALRAAGDRALVAGCIGPTGWPGPRDGGLSRDDAMQIFYDQACALLAAGVDLLALETFTSFEEASAAVDACRQVGEIPLTVSLAFDQNGSTLDGRGSGLLTPLLRSRGADVVGCNCSPDAGVMVSIVVRLRAGAADHVLAKPSAGIPGMIDGQLRYPVSPDDFVKQCRVLIKAGARYIGGCCGTSPAYIAALHRALQEDS
jgi:5-methyltetrahydrofolate--homocysteine methyltransferase